MQVTTIAQIFQMEADMDVLCVRGTVEKIFPIRQISGLHGDGTKQVITLKQGKDAVEAHIWDHDEIVKSSMGKMLQLSCSKSEKHGWVGVKTKDDTYKGKTTRILNATKTAILEWLDDGEQREQEQRHDPPRQRVSAPQQNTPAPQTAGQPARTTVYGPRVGMAMELIAASLEAQGIACGTSDYNRRLWEGASDVIRVAEMLEEGNLAPSAKEREAKKEAPKSNAGT